MEETLGRVNEGAWTEAGWANVNEEPMKEGNDDDSSNIELKISQEPKFDFYLGEDEV